MIVSKTLILQALPATYRTGLTQTASASEVNIL